MSQDHHNVSHDKITVEVAYALPHKQKIISLQVSEGTTAFAAVEQSKIADVFPELDIHSADMGIFGSVLGTKGTKKPQEHILQEHDRVEIYRPLIADPKEVRRQRAEKSKQAKT